MLFSLPLEIVASIISYLILPEDINNLRLVSLQAKECASNFVTEIVHPIKEERSSEKICVYIRASYIGLFYHLHTVKIPIILLNRSDLDFLTTISTLEANISYDPNLTRKDKIPYPPLIQNIIDTDMELDLNQTMQQFNWAIEHPNVLHNIPTGIAEMAIQYLDAYLTQTNRVTNNIKAFVEWISILLPRSHHRITYSTDGYVGRTPFVWVKYADNKVSIEGQCDPSPILSARPWKRILFNTDVSLQNDWFSLVQWIAEPSAGISYLSLLPTHHTDTVNKSNLILKPITKFSLRSKTVFGILNTIKNIGTYLYRLWNEFTSYPNIIDTRVFIDISDIDLFFTVFPNSQTLCLVYHLSIEISEDLIKSCFVKYPKLKMIRIYTHEAKDYSHDPCPLPPRSDIERKFNKRIVHRKSKVM